MCGLHMRQPKFMRERIKPLVLRTYPGTFGREWQKTRRYLTSGPAHEQRHRHDPGQIDFDGGRVHLCGVVMAGAVCMLLLWAMVYRYCL